MEKTAEDERSDMSGPAARGDSQASADVARALADPAVRRRVVRMCARAARSAAEADDLAQEVLLEAWRHRGKVTDPTGLERWLAGVTRIVLLRARSARE